MSHQVTWFAGQAPDRPVENGTVFVRPEPVELDEEKEGIDE